MTLLLLLLLLYGYSFIALFYTLLRWRRVCKEFNDSAALFFCLTSLSAYISDAQKSGCRSPCVVQSIYMLIIQQNVNMVSAKCLLVGAVNPLGGVGFILHIIRCKRYKNIYSYSITLCRQCRAACVCVLCIVRFSCIPRFLRF